MARTRSGRAPEARDEYWGPDRAAPGVPMMPASVEKSPAVPTRVHYDRPLYREPVFGPHPREAGLIPQPKVMIDGEAVDVGARQAVEQVAVALRPEQQLTDEQKRPALPDQLQGARQRHRHRLDELIRFAAVVSHRQPDRHEEMDALIREPGRRVHRDQWFDTLGGASRFLLELTACAVDRRLPFIQAAGRDWMKRLLSLNESAIRLDAGTDACRGPAATY